VIAPTWPGMAAEINRMDRVVMRLSGAIFALLSDSVGSQGVCIAIRCTLRGERRGEPAFVGREAPTLGAC